MKKTEIKTYRQDRPREFFQEYPNETWRCDIYPESGGDFHGVGRTEVLALIEAANVYRNYTEKRG